MKTKDIRINKELIMKYGPCLDGLYNFKKHYKDISIKQLINSKKVNYEHKVWLLKKVVPDYLLVLWSIDSAFAAYAYSNLVSNDYYDQATDSAFYAAYAAGNASDADYAYYAADYAEAAAYSASNATYFKDNDNSQKERLQALLYFIEGE